MNFPFASGFIEGIGAVYFPSAWLNVGDKKSLKYPTVNVLESIEKCQSIDDTFIAHEITQLALHGNFQFLHAFKNLITQIYFEYKVSLESAKKYVDDNMLVLAGFISKDPKAKDMTTTLKRPQNTGCDSSSAKKPATVPVILNSEGMSAVVKKQNQLELELKIIQVESEHFMGIYFYL